MTWVELQTSFKVGMNKVDTQYSKSYEPEEIDLFLNQAQEKIIKTRFESQNNFRIKAFEGSQKRIDDLRVLVKRASLVPTTTANVNEYTVTLPTDYLFYISSVGKIECGSTFIPGGSGSTDTNIVEIYNAAHADFNRMKKDPFNKPDYKRLLIEFETNKIYLYGEAGFFPIKYDLTYLRYPVKITGTGTVTSELPTHIHQEIINESIAIAVENAQDPRYQTVLNELNKQE